MTSLIDGLRNPLGHAVSGELAHASRRLHRPEHPRHLRVNNLDRLPRTEHDLEVDDLALVVPADHVDTVDRNAVDLGHELEDGVALSHDFADVAESTASTWNAPIR